MAMTRSSFDGDWFDTGDVASIDEDGYLKISGRTKDIIIRGGENIPVAYVEDVLYENPKIQAVAVVGMPDPRLQERACCFAVLKPGEEFTFEEMKRFLEEKGLAKPYWPERLEIVPEMPRTASGKIQKYRLREQFMGS
jgi:acyl-CoA synthetase (AMP-forming)/AMP-acid ligase II